VNFLDQGVVYFFTEELLTVLRIKYTFIFQRWPVGTEAAHREGSAARVPFPDITAMTGWFWKGCFFLTDSGFWR
jgi:hypothetical protein